MTERFNYHGMLRQQLQYEGGPGTRNENTFYFGEGRPEELLEFGVTLIVVRGGSGKVYEERVEA